MDEWTTIGFDHAPIGLVVAEDRVVRCCNLRFAEMFDYPQKALHGQSLSLLYPSADEFEHIGARGAKQMMRTGRYNDERIMRRRDGTLFWCRARGQSLTPDTPFARSIWSFADISEVRPVTAMTRRERQVATLIAEGHTSKEIARLLGISYRTVDVHRARLLDKFEVKNSLELVARLSGVPL